MIERTVGVTSAVALLLVACDSITPGADPHDMSAERHQQAGAAHAQEAEAHESIYDLEAARERCSTPPPPGSDVGSEIGSTCWTAVTNETEEHVRIAEEHRRHAAAHRAASAALRLVETASCQGIGLNDRDISPFERVEDIAEVRPLVEAGTKGTEERTVGAIVAFRAVPGMTVDWLRRLVTCHLARNATLGHDVPEMPDCPLVPRGVAAQVNSITNGFEVLLRSSDPGTAAEVLARANRLRP